MDSPLIIISELLLGIITNTFSTIYFVFTKLYELAMSLFFFSTLGIFGFLIAIAIGAVVFYTLSRFVLKNTRSLVSFGIAFAIVIAVTVALSMI